MANGIILNKFLRISNILHLIFIILIVEWVSISLAENLYFSFSKVKNYDKKILQVKKIIRDYCDYSLNNELIVLTIFHRKQGNPRRKTSFRRWIWLYLASIWYKNTTGVCTQKDDLLRFWKNSSGIKWIKYLKKTSKSSKFSELFRKFSSKVIRRKINLLYFDGILFRREFVWYDGKRS